MTAEPPRQPLAATTAGPRPWRLLFLFNLYRQVLAAGMTLLFFAGIGPKVLGRADPTLFGAAALAYLLVATVGNLLIAMRRPRFEVQTFGQLLIDVAFIHLMMHASGGISSGIGVLLITSVAGASTITAGRLAFLYAAIASLAILAGQVHAYFNDLRLDFAGAGLLGIGFFATALLAHVLARRMRETEALAEQRGVDLANLAQLTEFVIQRMQTGVIVTDDGGRIRFMNDSAWQLCGRPAGGPAAQQGQPLESVNAELAHRLRQWDTDPAGARRTVVIASGSSSEVAPRFAPLGDDGRGGMMLFLEDLSLLGRQAQQMKLASLGRLAGSIAHEIRNPLSAIQQAADLLGESSAQDATDQRLSRIIRDHTQRVNRIIENVLQVSRRSPAQLDDLRLAEWLPRFAEDFVQNQGVDAGVVSVEVERPDLAARADGSQLAQVMWNIAQNALEHGARRGAAPQRIEMRAGEDPITHRPYISVQDSGPGLPPEAARQIFEPFFTTEAQGTGLGLYIARELCEANQAQLELLPSERGACFRILFADPRRQALVA